MKDSMLANSPMLVMVRGLPGGGKSYLTREIEKQIGTDLIAVLDPDATDYSDEDYVNFSNSLLTQGVDAKLHPYRYLRSRAYEAILKGNLIIWNQAFTNQDLLHRTIVNLSTYASDNNLELRVLVVEVEVDPDTAKKRVANRAKSGGHDVSDEAFERFINDYSSFSEYGYNTISINGAGNVTNNASNVILEIEKLRKV